MSPEARSARSRQNASMRMTPEQHASRMHKVHAALSAMPPERRAEIGRKSWMNQTEEQRAARADKIRESKSHEERHEMALRAWETRRARYGTRCTRDMLKWAFELLALGRSLSSIARSLEVPRATITLAIRKAMGSPNAP